MSSGEKRGCKALHFTLPLGRDCYLSFIYVFMWVLIYLSMYLSSVYLYLSSVLSACLPLPPSFVLPSVWEPSCKSQRSKGGDLPLREGDHCLPQPSVETSYISFFYNSVFPSHWSSLYPEMPWAVVWGGLACLLQCHLWIDLLSSVSSCLLHGSRSGSWTNLIPATVMWKNESWNLVDRTERQWLPLHAARGVGVIFFFLLDLRLAWLGRRLLIPRVNLWGQTLRRELQVSHSLCANLSTTSKALIV